MNIYCLTDLRICQFQIVSRITIKQMVEGDCGGGGSDGGGKVSGGEGGSGGSGGYEQ